MNIHGIYFGKDEIYNMIRSEGGVWNDSKERPIFCLIESAEHAGLYRAIPMTDKYIEREYLNRYSQKQQVIKNKKLISELERKLFRILSDENANPNKYRQHITDIKNKLIEELDS